MKKLLVILIVVMVVLIGITGLVQGESFPVHVEVDDVSYDITYGGHETINGMLYLIIHGMPWDDGIPDTSIDVIAECNGEMETPYSFKPEKDKRTYYFYCTQPLERIYVKGIYDSEDDKQLLWEENGTTKKAAGNELETVLGKSFPVKVTVEDVSYDITYGGHELIEGQLSITIHGMGDDFNSEDIPIEVLADFGTEMFGAVNIEWDKEKAVYMFDSSEEPEKIYVLGFFDSEEDKQLLWEKGDGADAAEEVEQSEEKGVEGKTSSALLLFEETPYIITYKSHQIIDGQLSVTVVGLGNKIPFRNGDFVIPVWAAAECDGEMVDSTKVDIGNETASYTLDSSQMPEKIYVYSIDNEDSKQLIWEKSDDAADPEEADITDQKLVEEENADNEAETETDAIGIVLEELAEPLYNSAYEALLSGDPVRNGSQGDVVRSIQTLLNEFGKDLPLTGGFYNKSLAALQDIQRGFAMEKTDYIDAQIFEQLLVNLAIFRSTESESSEDFDHIAEKLGISWDEQRYLQACAEEMKGRFYKAYKGFYYSKWEDYQTRMETCVQQWPANGEIYHHPSYYSGGTTLKIEYGKSPEIAALIKIMSDDTLVSALFLGNSNSSWVSLPPGTYKIKTGLGSNWFGLKDAFGDEGDYETLLFDDGMKEVTLKYGYDYTLQINSSETLPDSDDVGSQYEPYDEF